VLSAHSLLIAVIFTAYIVLMAGLIVYACAAGRERSDDPPDTGEDGRSALPAVA